MNISVGLVQDRSEIRVTLKSAFRDSTGKPHPPGKYRFTSPVALAPSRPETDVFLIEDVTIGTGFHWERRQVQGFRGSLRVIETAGGLTAINEVPLEAYVESVIGSEISAESPIELLRAHAVISRSWLMAQIRRPPRPGSFGRRRETGPGEWELVAWYGRETHEAFDVCADDHCQRYQGIGGATSENAVEAVRSTAGRFLIFDDEICDARFSKCCGGVTEAYRAAWDDRDVPYLRPQFDGDGPLPRVDEGWIRSSPEAYCNTADRALLERVLPGFDQETRDFFRWSVDYDTAELGSIVRERSGIDVGDVAALEPLERGASGRIVRLKIQGRAGSITLGKELEIRRVLSRSHLYSSAFVVDMSLGRIHLAGAGWGHGVGLCQIGAAVMAAGGVPHEKILEHYYPGARVLPAPG